MGWWEATFIHVFVLVRQVVMMVEEELLEVWKECVEQEQVRACGEMVKFESFTYKLILFLFGVQAN